MRSRPPSTVLPTLKRLRDDWGVVDGLEALLLLSDCLLVEKLGERSARDDDLLWPPLDRGYKPLGHQFVDATFANADSFGRLKRRVDQRVVSSAGEIEPFTI